MERLLNNFPELSEVENYAVELFRLPDSRVFDEPHTRAVVHYADRIASSEELDVLVILTAAWLHDIGYSGLFKGVDSTDYETVQERKKLHAVNGSGKAREFLQRPEVSFFYTQEQRARVVHLVQVHDEVESLVDLDEVIIMEADTLGQIDVERVTPTFNYDGGMKYIKGLRERRIPRFRTRVGTQCLNELLPRFVAYFDDLRES